MNLPMRQIHLDFHTSEHIPNVGRDFEPRAFAEAYKDAHVQSVTLFARCHHGWCYYDTEIGERHPNLSFDLLRAQVDALHAVGIATPIYITTGWDEKIAREHADWRVQTPDGKFIYANGGEGDLDTPRWAQLDHSTPYLEFLDAQIREVASKFPDADGIFLDICHNYPSCSPAARKQMAEQGLDWMSLSDREEHARQTRDRYMKTTVEAARSANPDIRIVHNHGTMIMGDRNILSHNTHLELESLPTGGWGYDHFPIIAKYAEEIGANYLGMTGKFHTLWGEFGGFKSAEALRYECSAMLAMGAGCSIGDHLHPSGKHTPSTMRLIGSAYAEVAEKEPWCVDSKNIAEIALLSARAVNCPDAQSWEHRAVHNDAEEGAGRLLLEEGFLFDVIDTQSDISRYRLVILPDELEIDEETTAKLNKYVEHGGRLLSTGHSGFDSETGENHFECGAIHEGESEFESDFAVFSPELAPEGVEDPMLLYERSIRLRPTDGEVLGEVFDPYFDRTFGRFNGHMNSPYVDQASGYAAIIRKGNIVQTAHQLFSIYYRNGPVPLRRMLGNLVRLSLGQDQMVKHSLPAGGRVTLRQQEDRKVLHLLFATPQLRGKFRGRNVEVIQDLPVLRDISVSLETTSDVQSVRIVPSGEELTFTVHEGRLNFVVPHIQGHSMIEIARSELAED